MNKILKKLPKKARYNLFLADIILGTIIVCIIAIVKTIINNLNFIPPSVNLILKILFYGFITYKLLDLAITQLIGYRRIQYSIDKKSVEKITGVLFLSHEIVPIHRIQQVDITQGPINKLFELSSIKIVTAGGSVELEYIEDSEVKEIADLLRDQINQFAKEAKREAHIKILTDNNYIASNNIDKNTFEFNNKDNIYE